MLQRVVRHSPLAGFQRAATKAVAALTKEINQREHELAALKAEAARWQQLLRAPGHAGGPVVPAPRRRAAKRRRLDWNAILQELPARFTIKDIAQNTGR